MDIKLVGLDLDGTLLLPDKTVSQENKRVLTKAAESEGVHIVIATGRPYSGIKKILEWLPYVRYAVLSNGAVVLDVKTGEKIAEHRIDVKDALEFYDYAVSKNLSVDFFDKGERIVAADWKEVVAQMDESDGTKNLLLSNCIFSNDQRAHLASLPGVEKISIRFLKEQDQAALYEKVQKHFPQLKICASLATNIEATCRNVTKATGMQELALNLGISMESVMAFGDNGNDREMLEEAGIGVAMGNSDEAIKRLAKRVTKRNTEDGVAYMIREVFGWQQELL
ncbi:MAG: Cof-type HAD-IIB family hydrolase [Lachnospiraceae bacterium]|nr:Cof-type HAD-IIB family hydrolase [Lachnospiraceae bacterium]